MAAQVVVGTVGDALKFAPAPREAVLDVVGVLGVMGQLVRVVTPEAQVLGTDAVLRVPTEAFVEPRLQPLVVGARLHEVLDFHLLEFAGSEGEVARRNLVAEGLAYLGDAEGELAAGGREHVGEVNEDALGRFRSQVHLMGGVFDWAHEGLEHQAELARVGQLATTVGADSGIDLVLAVALVALATLHQGVAEAGYVAAGDPHLRVHQNGGVQPYDVIPLLHHRVPPEVLKVALQLHA